MRPAQLHQTNGILLPEVEELDVLRLTTRIAALRCGD
jgi:hypothetical protein